MYPRHFEYFSPKNLIEALDLIQNEDVETKILAGGQSLIPSMKLRKHSPKRVIDITNIKDLNYIRKEENMLKIGALTTTSTLENDIELASLLPVLRETASEIADPLVRNLGTIGGDLCYADPRNDLPPVMLALNATFTAISKHGTRNIPVESFFLGVFRNQLKLNEILTEIQIPIQKGKVGSAYRKIKKGSGGFTIAGVATYVSILDDKISDCRIAMAAVGPKPLRAKKAEQTLTGKTFESSTLDNVAELAVEASKPATDVTASENYRRKALHILVKDSLQAAHLRATGC